MLLLSSSHLTVHTWPEHGYAAIDVFHCDPSAGAGATSTPPADVSAAVAALVQSLGGDGASVRETRLGRGVPTVAVAHAQL
jgi:S-adenosylmethionine decarboxylase